MYRVASLATEAPRRDVCYRDHTCTNVTHATQVNSSNSNMHLASCTVYISNAPPIFASIWGTIIKNNVTV